ncbi:hypothetical protein GYMLUDRAFT_772064 [Collybiopsis luxurians FD-317 M1]|uniref:Uncharacterized protein n=1 Tax=Collybiopsis luxurians FD-317 M1 TaxID=944289 RepID=A0A0D0CP47_9AGAR|nr:hypothetical protein GYMLUDRAFT_772064 [Collybiopsis luxurians FD-317 M1]
MHSLVVDNTTHERELCILLKILSAQCICVLLVELSLIRTSTHFVSRNILMLIIGFSCCHLSPSSTFLQVNKPRDSRVSSVSVGLQQQPVWRRFSVCSHGSVKEPLRQILCTI